MNTRRRTGSQHERTPARNNPMVWFLGILSVAGTAWLLLTLVAGMDAGTALIALACGSVLVSLGTGAVVRARRGAPGHRHDPPQES